MGANIPLPALAVNPQQQQDPMASIKNVLALRNLQTQQQTQQLQQQAVGQENQQRALDLQDQQNMRKLAPQFVQKDANGQPTGYDADGYYNALMGAGVSPPKIIQMRNQQAEMTKNLAAASAAQLDLNDKKNNEAYQIAEGVRSIANQPNVDPAKIATAYQQAIPQLQRLGMDVSKFPPQFQTRGALIDGLDQFEVGLGVHKQVLEDARTQAQTQEATGKGAQAQAEAAKTQAEMPGVQAAAAVAPRLSLLSILQKQAELGQAKAYTAAAWANTAKTKVETANLGEQPIFAVDPATNERVMTTRPEQQAKGYTNPVAVKEGDVSKETDARAMINDVQLNKSRYLAAMQQVYSQPMTNAQKTALVALTPEKLGVDFGSLFKLEMPDVMQKVANASAFSVLSPQQKQAVVGYYSTLASVPAAQKALTNIGRSNKEMMDLELRTIPTPIMDEGTFGTMLDRFQGNIDQTSRKTVRMPGMPSTSDIRNLYEGGQQSPQSGRQPNGPAVNFNMPRPMNTVPLWSLLKSQGQ
jgi:hypothetical protein